MSDLMTAKKIKDGIDAEFLKSGHGIDGVMGEVTHLWEQKSGTSTKYGDWTLQSGVLKSEGETLKNKPKDPFQVGDTIHVIASTTSTFPTVKLEQDDKDKWSIGITRTAVIEVVGDAVPEATTTSSTGTNTTITTATPPSTESVADIANHKRHQKEVSIIRQSILKSPAIDTLFKKCIEGDTSETSGPELADILYDICEDAAWWVLSAPLEDKLHANTKTHRKIEAMVNEIDMDREWFKKYCKATGFINRHMTDMTKQQAHAIIEKWEDTITPAWEREVERRTPKDTVDKVREKFEVQTEAQIEDYIGD